MRCFSAALNFMIRERRRYFRHPVEITGTIIFSQGYKVGEGQKLNATITNISEAFTATNCSEVLPPRRFSSFLGSPVLWNRRCKSPGWTNLAAPAFASPTCPRILVGNWTIGSPRKFGQTPQLI